MAGQSESIVPLERIRESIYLIRKQKVLLSHDLAVLYGVETRVLVQAVQARDYPVVMAATAISAALVVLGNLLADLGVAWADPRVRGSSD